MNNQVLMWGVVVAVLLLIFCFRMFNKFHNSLNHHSIFEIGDDYSIYSSEDDVL
ncbi:MAG: hypothetical protein ACMV14_00240 [Prevotella sp.]|nr:hypothetical protein [Prevotella sp.]